MKIRLPFALVALLVAAALPACKDKKSADTQTTGAALDTTPAAAPKAASAAAAAPKDPTLEEFVAKTPAAACKTLTTCKNDKVKAVASMSAMLVVGFGTIDKPDLAKDVKSIDTAWKNEKRFLPTESECNTLGGIAMKVVGMDASTLAPHLGKTIAYDAQKAGACLASLSTQPAACAEEVKLAAEPKMKEIESMEKELKPSLDGFAKPCEGVLTGLVESGGACEIDAECKGEKAKCKPAAAAKNGKAAKGSKAAKAAPEGKTCQSSTF